MAKPRPVKGVKAGGKLAPNARRVLAVRIDEVYQYDGDVADPANVTELHDMRIACKRLRYLLEIFGTAFAADLDPYVDEVKALQDVLGDIHDCDVQVPMLEEHLRWLDAREGEALAALLADEPAGAAPRGAARVEAAYARFRGRFDGARRADERPGLHTMIAMRRAQRDVLYAQFIARWRRLKTERFRAHLEDALGIG